MASVIHSFDFESVGITPEQILAIRPTEEENQRFEDLNAKKKDGGLTGSEEAELNQFFAQEQTLTMAKLKAEQIIQSRRQA
jgi:hypothetical protein